MNIFKLISILPVGINNCSKKNVQYFDLLERLFVKNIPSTLQTYKKLVFNLSNKHERMLFYLFDNIICYYRNSNLGHYIYSYIERGDVFLDVGANFGMYSYLAKQRGAHVLTFEPEPSHADFLKRNNILYDEFFEIALHSSNGFSDFYLGNIENPGIHSLVLGNQTIKESDYKDSTKISTKRLDSILTQEELLQDVELVKIDVEGAEFEVLKGMTCIFDKGYTPKIWCEVRSEKSNRNPKSFLKATSLLSDYGYTPLIYDKKTVKKFNGAHKSQVFDLLFIRNY